MAIMAIHMHSLPSVAGAAWCLSNAESVLQELLVGGVEKCR